MTSVRVWIVLVCLELAKVIDVGWWVLMPLLIVPLESFCNLVAEEYNRQKVRAEIERRAKWPQH